MLFERIESEGLAHYSYLIGDGNEAVVIDPRRDCQTYIERTVKKGFQITDILETHRNEDYVVGSLELADRTDAKIWHADTQLDYRYGNPIEDRQKWGIGGLKLEALLTPGHTPGHMSYLLYDHADEPWMVFTGDALFAGGVGRVDLLGEDKIKEMAELLYDTLFNKILPLGDHVIVSPAHGAGSVCGASIVDRPWTTIGIERDRNPKLQYIDKQKFIKNVGEKLERPPYFRQMEKLNVQGPPILGTIPTPKPLSPGEFEEMTQSGVVLDTRMELGFNTAHISNSLSIWLEGLPNFTGWFVPYEKPILLINETNDPSQTVSFLIRLGYDNIVGYLSENMHAWHMAGKKSSSIDTVTVQEMCSLLDKGESVWILDVRDDEEVKKAKITNAHHIHLTQLPENLDKIPEKKEIYIFCGSGLRSTIAASLLKREGWKNIKVILGGVAGWNSTTCPIE